MEEGLDKNLDSGKPKKYEFFSKVVRAGKRTYFFDVRCSLNKEIYITITESKKCENQSGGVFYEKHKLFLYPEDFEMFANGLTEITAYLKTLDVKSLDEISLKNANHKKEIIKKGTKVAKPANESLEESFVAADETLEEMVASPKSQ